MCSLTRHGKIFVLRLLGDGEHWLNPTLSSQIRLHLATVQSSPDAGALITTNDGKFFCNGLDLPWMQEQDTPDRFSLLMHNLNDIVLALMRLNVPTMAAICGHAAAGGLLLAMAHDHRFMRRDRGFLYSSAVDINVVVPPASTALLRSKMGPKPFKDLVLKGMKYTGNMAVESGLVDACFDGPEQTFDAALKEASELADRKWDRVVYPSLRASMYPDVIQKLEAEKNDSFDGIGFV